MSPVPPQRNLDDVVLVGLIAKGDQTAFSKFMSANLKQLTVFTTRFLATRSDGEDVAQQVFVDVWQKAHTFDGNKASPKTWLYTIARNRCIDVIRKRQLRQMVGLDDKTFDLFVDAPSPTQVVENRQELRRTLEALHRLPERQRLALLLSAVADLPVREIARVLKTSEGATEQLLVRARKRLRQAVAFETRP